MQLFKKRQGELAKCLPAELAKCLWRRGVVVITAITNAQLRSTKPELRFSTCSLPVRSVSQICDGEDL